ncbi:MAG: ATP-binding protein [Actinobacteria bacterium]|nr:ATP-binding protein [Actinomycetota bacterium]
MSTREEGPPSALLSFTASNVRSYRDEVHFSLLATRLAGEEIRRPIQTRSSKTPLNVLPAAGLFGANASGKSTFLQALADMRATVATSFRSGSSSSGMYRRPFLLDEDARSRPTSFEIELVLSGVHWQYGFEVDDANVVGEYAYHYPNGRQALVFDRTQSKTSFGASFRSSGRKLDPLLRDNALLLSVAGAANDKQLEPLFAWFLRNLRLAQSTNRASRVVRTSEIVQDPATKHRVMALLRAADLGICDIERAPIDPDVAERLQRVLRVLQGVEGDPETTDEDMNVVFEDSVRLKHQGLAGEVSLEPEFESQGTMVWVGLIGPVLDALDGGHVLLADELDASLHPHLVKLLLEMFQDPSLNQRCAQLIFNAHDVSILGDSDQSILGRDQIWFARKDPEGATSVYPLVDFRPRRDEALARRYLQGRFGAVPVINPGEARSGLELVDK